MYYLSQKSRNKLTGVHDDLIEVVNRAIAITPVDFGISQGLRTISQQKQLVQSGLSQTMRSRHLTGHAVDLFAYVDGEVSWEFDYYIEIADAMLNACKSISRLDRCEGIPIVWGAAWHKPLNQFTSALDAMMEYKELRKSQGRTPFLDGVHFQLDWEAYP
jgi:peptidoglycan L-alanyl-D-glutamate endopeptidase CwlK